MVGNVFPPEHAAGVVEATDVTWVLGMPFLLRSLFSSLAWRVWAPF